MAKGEPKPTLEKKSQENAKRDDANNPIDNEGEKPNVFEGKKSVLNFISDKVRQDWEKEVLEKEALKQQMEAESAASDAVEQLRKFAGNSGNISAGAAGTSPQPGIFDTNKTEEEKTGESEEGTQPQEQSEDEKEKGDPNEPSVKDNEKNGKKTKNRKKENIKTFPELLQISKEKQLNTLSKIESGGLEVSHFSELAHYLSEIEEYYKKEKTNIETLSEPNRKDLEKKYESTKEEIKSRWEQVRDMVVLRVKGYIDEEVERLLNKLQKDISTRNLSKKIDPYTLKRDGRIKNHAMPSEVLAMKMINEYFREKKKKINGVYWKALDEKNGAGRSESTGKDAGNKGFKEAFKEAEKEAEAGAKKGADGGEKKKERTEQEKRERRQKLEELFAMYEKLANAEEVEEIFKEFNVSVGSSSEAALKSEYRKLQKKVHPNNFSNDGDKKFSKEADDIAKEAAQILLAFYNEALEKAKRSFGYSTARRDRQSVQNGNRDKWRDNIEAAMKAEDLFSEENEPEQGKTEKGKEAGGAESAENGSAEGSKGSEKNESDGAGAERSGEGGATSEGAGEERAGAERSDAEKENAEAAERERVLEEKLADFRNEYVKTERKNKGMLDELKRFFGKSNFEDGDVKDARKCYEKALDDYRHQRIENLRKKSQEGGDIKKEMQDLLMMFKYGEVIELADAKTNAKLESIKDTTWGKIRSVPAKIASVYNKIPLWGKLALSGAAFVSGSVAFVTGKRILGGIVTGVGLAKGYEALDQKIIQKVAQGSTKLSMEEIESLGGDGIDRLNEILDKHLSGDGGVVERTQNMINRRNRGKAAAVAIGGAMAVLGVSKLAEGFFNEDTVQAKGFIDYEKFKGIFGLGEQPGSDLANPFLGGSSGNPFPLEQEISSGPIAQGLKEAATGAQGADIHLEVASGSGKGIEHMLIETLKQKGVENPGTVAHRMVLEYADNNDLTVDKLSHIKSASFDIEPGGKEGFRIKDLKFDASKGHVEHVVGGENIGQTATYTETHVPLDGSRISEATEQSFAQEASISDSYLTQRESMFNRLSETKGELNAAATRHVSPPSGAFLHDDNFGPKQVTDLHGPDPERVAELAAQRDTYAQAIEKLGAKNGTFKGISGSVMKGISGNNIETWKQVKGIAYNEAMNSPETKVKMLNTFAKFKDVLGEDAIKPLNGGREKVGSMVSRLAKDMANRSV